MCFFLSCQSCWSFLLFLLVLILLPLRHTLKRVFEITRSCFLFCFPFVGKFLDERLVASWREKQEELKLKLVIEDTEEWQRRIWEVEEAEEEAEDVDDNSEEGLFGEGNCMDLEREEGDRRTPISNNNNRNSNIPATSASSSSPSILRLVGGVDVSFGSDGVSACASLVVCDMKRSLEVVYEDFIPFRLTTPYRPG